MARPLVVVILGSLACTTILVVSAVVTATLVLVLPGRTLRQRYALAQGWARLQLVALRHLCGLTYEVRGLEHLPPGQHVCLWKHSSTWETLAQMVIFPPQAWVLKREILWLPLIGAATRRLQPIAIDRAARSTAVAQVVALGKERLRAGLWVLVFPEGTRVAVGEQRRFGISGALLAVEAGCLVIPVAHNAGRYWPRRSLLKWPGRIEVVIGPPIATVGREPRDVNDAARAWIEREVEAIGG